MQALPPGDDPPEEAEDIGDVDVRPNPRASDLGMPEGLSEPVWGLYSDSVTMGVAAEELTVDSDTFIEDLTDWA